MRFTIFAILVTCFIGGSASAVIYDVVAPDSAVTGEVYTPLIMGDMPSSCWYFGSMEVTEEEYLFVVTATIWYENYSGGLCLGPTEPWELDPEFVFTYPGTWTLRVVEHHDHPAIPDYPDYVWEKEVSVTGPVSTDSMSFSKVKALFR